MCRYLQYCCNYSCYLFTPHNMPPTRIAIEKRAFILLTRYSFSLCVKCRRSHRFVNVMNRRRVLDIPTAHWNHSLRAIIRAVFKVIIYAKKTAGNTIVQCEMQRWQTREKHMSSALAQDVYNNRHFFFFGYLNSS